MRTLGPLAAALLICASCEHAVVPATLDSKNDTCSFCRMTVSDRRLAAQIVSRGDDPRFFDDLNCLALYLREHRQPIDGRVFVADHRTGDWVLASSAVYTRVPHAATPMGSGLVAHATADSRAADLSVKGGEPVAAVNVLGAPAETRSR